jgi:cell division protease FtsH
MISYFGMSDKIGNRSYFDSSGQSEFSFSKPYSEKTAELIDDEVKAVVDAQYRRAKSILSKNKAKLTKLAERLLESEVIFSDDLEEIFGKRPWKTEEEEEKQKSVEKAREKQKKIVAPKRKEAADKKEGTDATAEKDGTDAAADKNGTNTAAKEGGTEGPSGDREKKATKKHKDTQGSAEHENKDSKEETEDAKPENSRAKKNAKSVRGKEQIVESKSTAKKSGE